MSQRSLPLTELTWLKQFMRKRFALWFVLLMSTATLCCADDIVQKGENLFYGREALKGTLYLHNRSLDTSFVRCMNCHRFQDEQKTSNKSDFGPEIGAHFLLTKNSLRGGPARAYEADSFCQMLRTGMDPSQIMMRTDMPRYSVSDDDCHALWRFLLTH
ncbi:hypothetical protein ACO0K0_18235 [Undibacterium sp. SXout11W]|uniref:hypothetical protein n=1 Tax=Undibacterium sp. SXout11W TaxID=3413050 RepID=UPI003BF1A140